MKIATATAFVMAFSMGTVFCEGQPTILIKERFLPESSEEQDNVFLHKNFDKLSKNAGRKWYFQKETVKSFTPKTPIPTTDLRCEE